MNVECRRNVYYLFYKKIKRSETILQNSAVRCLIQAIEAGSLIIKKTCQFGVVSYERFKGSEVQITPNGEPRTLNPKPQTER